MSRTSRRVRGIARRVLAATAVAGVLLAVSAARGGGTDLHVYSEPGESLFGWGVGGVGDVDMDGTPDFAIGAKGAAATPFFSAGSVSVYSGADGALLYRVRGSANSQGLGTSIAALGDVNADGRSDFVVGAPSVAISNQPVGHARVCSGLDGSEIRRVSGISALDRFGDVVANVGDVTGDGIADFAVGAPGTTGAHPGSSRVYSGADGTPVLALAQNGSGGANLGRSIAGLGDVTGDGIPDFAVGAPASDPKNRNRLHIGEVRVISGANGVLVRRHAGKKIGDRFGYSVASAGDQDGDGTQDLLVGAFGTKGVGEVTLWSGRTGRKLKSLRGIFPNGRFGLNVAAIGDVNGDGRPEIVIGSQLDGSGDVLVVSLGAKKPLYLHRGAPDELAGDFFAPIGDLDADGRPELLIGGWGGNTARVVSVDTTPLAIPAALSYKLTFALPAGATEPGSGSVKVNVKGVTQTLQFKFKGLDPAASSYTLQLEDAPAAGTYRRIGFLQVTNGKAKFVLTGQYLPPGPLGVQTLADLAGRRIELLDGMNVILEVLIP